VPLSELQMKETLRVATDWLVTSDLPGSPAAREGIADVIGLMMMDAVDATDVDGLASLVIEHGDRARGGVSHDELRHAVEAAFAHVKATAPPT
jgi:hypothetical protein